MLTFVRLLAFAELIGGMLWLWPAVFPHRVTPQDYADSFPRVPVEPVPVSPLPGVALIGIGSITLSNAAARSHGAP